MSHRTTTTDSRLPTFAVLLRFLAARRRHHGKQTQRRYHEVLDVILEHLSALKIGAVEFAWDTRPSEPAYTRHSSFTRVIHADALIALLEELLGADERPSPALVSDRFARYVVRALICWIRDEAMRVQAEPEYRASAFRRGLTAPATPAAPPPRSRLRTAFALKPVSSTARLDVWRVNPALMTGLPEAV